MGLGFLCKGPIILLLVGLTVVPYLVVTRRLAEGTRPLRLFGACFFFLLSQFPGRFVCSLKIPMPGGSG